MQDACEFLKDPETFVAQLRKNTTSSGVRAQLVDICALVDIKNTGDVRRCIQEARNIFDSNYDHSIRDLKSLFPDDHKDSSGQPFWSGPKRSPQPETFNVNDQTNFDFVYNCTNLILATIGMSALPEDQVRTILEQLPAQPYVKKVIVVETPEEAKEREASGAPAPKTITDDDDDDLIIT